MIAEQLSGDPLLRRSAAAHAGIRTPGAWDAFEIAVRAILGQQISVQAATTIAGRVAERWGIAASSGIGGRSLASFQHPISSPMRRSKKPASSRRAPRRCDRWRARSVTAASCSTASSTIDGAARDSRHRRLDRAVCGDARAQRARRLPVGRSGAAAHGRRLQRARARTPQRALAALARLRGDVVVAGGQGSRRNRLGGFDMRKWTLPRLNVARSWSRYRRCRRRKVQAGDVADS